jgi:hypothetical protein
MSAKAEYLRGGHHRNWGSFFITLESSVFRKVKEGLRIHCQVVIEIKSLKQTSLLPLFVTPVSEDKDG